MGKPEPWVTPASLVPILFFLIPHLPLIVEYKVVQEGTENEDRINEDMKRK